MAFEKGLNPDIVLNGLDAVFVTEFEKNPGPMMCDATDASVLHQGSTRWSAVQSQVLNDGGLWSAHQEMQDLEQATINSGTKRNFTVVDYKQALPISRELMRDEGYGVVSQQVRKMAVNARQTRDREAFGLFRDAFANTLTNEGVALLSNSHSTLSGQTVDNLISGALSETSLNLALIGLVEQLNQSGTIGGHQGKTLLVPPAIFKLACEIVDSELKSGGQNNDINVYSSKYGIEVKQSKWLGAAAGGSDSAWFLLADMHPVHRWVREDVRTDYVSPEYSSNDTAFYKGSFAETYGAPSYEGIVGSAG